MKTLKYTLYRGNFGEVFDLADLVKIDKLKKTHQYRLLHAYGAKNSDNQNLSFHQI